MQRVPGKYNLLQKSKYHSLFKSYLATVIPSIDDFSILELQNLVNELQHESNLLAEEKVDDVK